MVRGAANSLRSNRGASRLDVIWADVGARGRRVHPRVVTAWLAVWRAGHRPIRGTATIRPSRTRTRPCVMTVCSSSIVTTVAHRSGSPAPAPSPSPARRPTWTRRDRASPQRAEAHHGPPGDHNGADSAIVVGPRRRSRTRRQPCDVLVVVVTRLAVWRLAGRAQLIVLDGAGARAGQHQSDAGESNQTLHRAAYLSALTLRRSQEGNWLKRSPEVIWVPMRSGSAGSFGSMSSGLITNSWFTPPMFR
jgi:hypothetical protein